MTTQTKDFFHTNHFFKNSAFLLSGILIGASMFLLTQASYTVQTNIDNAVQVIKRIVLQQADGVTTGSVLSGDTINTVHMQATEYCDEHGDDCVDIADVYTGTVSAGGESLWNTGTSDSINYMSGNVGIGTDTPSTILDVSGTINSTRLASPQIMATEIIFEGGNEITYSGFTLASGDIEVSDGSLLVNGDILTQHTNSDKIWGFLPPPGGLFSTLQHPINGNSIKISGEDGIAPSGDAADGGSIYINGGAKAGTSHSKDGNILLANERGNVGIGTSTPDYKLQVSGDIVPETNGVSSLGTSSLKWNIYGNDANISTIETKDITGKVIVATKTLVIPHGTETQTPTSAVTGQIYFATDGTMDGVLKVFDGNNWISIN